MDEIYHRQMGFGNPSYWPQARFYNYSPFSFHKYQGTVFEGQGRSFRYRDSVIAVKRGHRISPSRDLYGGFLQQSVFSNKEIRRNAPSNKFKAIKQVYQEAGFQDGNISFNTPDGEKGRLGLFDRPQGCIFSCTGSTLPSKVSQISLEGSGVPVCMPSVRPKTRTSAFHQGPRPSDGTFTQSSSTNIPLSRRYNWSSKHTAISSSGKGPGNNSVTGTGIPDKLGKVKFSPNPGFGAFKSKVEIRSGFGNAVSRQTATVTSGSTHSFEYKSSTGPHCVVVSGSNCISNYLCPTSSVNEKASSEVFKYTMETIPSGLHRSFSDCIYVSSGKRGDTLVVKSTECVSGKPVPHIRASNSLNDRLILGRMGGPSRGPDGQGAMESGQCRGTYQCVRTTSSSEGLNTLSGSGCPEKSANLFRQCHNSTIYKPPRGVKELAIMSDSNVNLEMGSRPRSLVNCSSFSRQAEYNSGCSVKKPLGPQRMVLTPHGVQTNFSSARSTQHRFICNPQVCQTSSLLLLEAGPRSISHRFNVNVVDGNPCVCIPTILYDSQGTSKDCQVNMQSFTGSTQMAQTGMVCETSQSVKRGPQNIVCDPQISENSGAGNLSPRSRNVEFDGLAIIRSRMRQAEIPTEAQDIILDSWRSGTAKQYSAKTRLWCSWCSKRGVDPIQAPLGKILQFLTYLVQERGLAHSSVNGYRSAISACHTFVDNKPVGQHPWICKFLKGVFNRRPPSLRLFPAWDVQEVIKVLSRGPYTPSHKASLLCLLKKLAVLLALTSGRRVSDIFRLSIDQGKMELRSDGVEFQPIGLGKADRPSHHSVTIFIPSYPINKEICPLDVLKVYLKRTESLRSNHSWLFIKSVPDYSRASKDTIRRWIVDVIAQANQPGNTSRAGHSRKTASSYAEAAGVSMERILQAADWTQVSTFKRHYRVSVANPRTLFGRAVLGNVHQDTDIVSESEVETDEYPLDN